MVDSTTGGLTLSQTLRFHAGDTLETIKTRCAAANPEVADMQTGWQWLTVRNLRSAEEYFILSVGFHDDALKRIQLIVSPTPFDLKVNWDDWSEADERKILVELRRWVVRQLGREGTFNWGSIRAAYDPRSGSSTVTITYT